MATTIGSLDLNAFSDLHSDLTQYFWFESNATATYGAGVHVTLVPDTSFISNPTGQNILMNTDGFSIRNGLLPMMTLDNDSLDFNLVDTTAGTYTTMATFGLSGVRIYSRDSGNNLVQLANIGYGEGATQIGTDVVPYYTLGVRKTTTTAYSSSSTYVVGDMCVYDEKVYVCIYNITTPESWTESHWKYYRGSYSHAEGYSTIASGYYSHAEGGGTAAIGGVSHAEGGGTTASGSNSHAEGRATTASGSNSHAEGNETTASETSSHAEGYSTIASESYSHAEGYSTEASGDGSHAEGWDTTASGDYSHAEGGRTTAIGDYSHAEGYGTITGGYYSHAEGMDTEASGYYSHAEGVGTEASGYHSHAEGYSTTASGANSHAQNLYTVATGNNQTVIGKLNAATVSGSGTTSDPYVYTDVGDYAFIIGNGTSNSTTARSNAFTVDWKGGIQMYLDSDGTSSSAATSGDDMDLFNAIYNLGWYSSVIV